MKWLLVICALLAVTNIVSSRPNKEKDEAYDDVLNDDDGYGNIGDDDDDDLEGEGDNDEEPADPPIMKSKDLIIKTMEGKTIYLPCETENAESYSVMWKVNSAMIYQDKISVGQKNDRIQRFDNQTLQIRDVQASDDGEYECSISTSPLIYVRHSLKVLTAPKIAKATANKKTSATVERGGSLELECIAEGNPLPRVSWSKAGRRVSAEHAEYGTSRVYKQNVGREDTGLYSCMADNENQKEPVLLRVNVDVTHKPDMKIEKEIAGETEMHLICRVHAFPVANVTWNRKNKPVKENDNIKVEHVAHSHDYILKFKKVDKSNFGNYTCVARNTYGQAERHIHVNGAPLVPKYENHQYIGDNNELKTKWSVMSLTPISKTQLQYRKKGDTDKTWHTENAAVNEASGYLHEVEHILKHLGEGVYEARLRAENEHGWSDYSKSISIEGKPSADSISKKDDSIVDMIEEPESSTNSGRRTIFSSSLLLVILLSMYRSFV